jgi:hypothetical protein
MAELEIRIAKPCNQSWTAMKGDERVRFCGSCQKNVFNISEMTRDEVEELIRKTDGVFCARLYRRTDNRVMTKDCPKGVAAYRRKRALVLVSGVAAMVYAFPLHSTSRMVGAVRRVDHLHKVQPAEPVLGDAVAESMVMGKLAVIPKRK